MNDESKKREKKHEQFSKSMGLFSLVHANPVAATEAPWLLLEAFDHSKGGERAGMRRREEYRKLLEGSGTGT